MRSKSGGRSRFVRVWAIIFALSFSLSGLTMFSGSVSALTYGDFEYQLINGDTEVEITHYYGTDQEVIIPSIFEGKPVTSIGRGSFSGTSITSIELPSTLKKIEEAAFYDQWGLASISIPENVSYIGPQAFFRCYSLTSFNVDSRNQFFTDIGGILYNKNISNLIQCLRINTGILTVPESVRSINDWAFFGCFDIKQINLPTNLISIGKWAFADCSGIRSITLPENLKRIDDSAFFQSGLTSIFIPKNVEYIGSSPFSLTYSLSSIDVDVDNPYFTSVNGVLFDKSVSRLIEVPSSKGGDYVIPHSVVTIGDCAFYYSSIKSVIMGDNVISIGGSCFERCQQLISVHISKSVTSISWYPFRGSESLKEIVVDEDNQYYTSVDNVLYDKNITRLIAFPPAKTGSFSIPNTVIHIESYAFFLSRSLTSLVMGDGVVTIGEQAFDGCVNLSSVTFGHNVTNIGQHSFGSCISLTSITIPQSVEIIGTRAFYQCESLMSIFFEGDAPLYDDLFRDCDDNLTIYYPVNANGFTTPTWGGVSAYPLTLPTMPIIITHISDRTAIQITWDNVSMAQSYNIYRGLSNDSMVLVGVSNCNHFVDDDVQPGTEYYYSVSAVNFVGESQLSDVLIVKTTPEKDLTNIYTIVIVAIVSTVLLLAGIVIIRKKRGVK